MKELSEIEDQFSTKKAIPKRKVKGVVDYIALGLTTFGVGYIPGAPGTYGSAVAVGIYLGVVALVGNLDLQFPVRAATFPGYMAIRWAAIPILLTVFCLVGIW